MLETTHASKMSNRSSNKSFGIVMAIFFLLVGFFPLLKSHPVRVWAVAIAILFLFFALVFPAALAVLNKIWFQLGLLLHKVTSPLILGIMFFLIITPTGFVRRLLGNKTLRESFDKSKKSYWVQRTPPGPVAESFKNQF